MDIDAKALAEKCVAVLDEKLAKDIKLLRVADITSLAEYFVICTANSNTQVKSLSDNLEMKLKEEGIEPHHIEGMRGGHWVLMDYSHVVVHIMHRESREFYNIERLWSDGEEIDIAPIVAKEDKE